MKYFTFLLLLLQSVCHSQNLVPNGGFEEHTGCPTGYPDLEGVCNNWHSYAGSCDYINACSDVCGYSNQYGFQTPHGGEGYAGIINYVRNIPNTREHLGCALTQSLMIGQKYFLSMYVCHAWNQATMNISSNRIGINLSTNDYFFEDISQNLSNRSILHAETIISDTINWTHLFSSFIADSSYAHLEIGNFYDDSLILQLNDPSEFMLNFVSYYYIDDVCLSADSAYCQSWTGALGDDIQLKKITLYPNPSSENIKLNGLISDFQFQIISLDGKNIEHGQLSSDDPTIQISKLERGIYFINIYSTRENYTFKFCKDE